MSIVLSLLTLSVLSLSSLPLSLSPSPSPSPKGLSPCRPHCVLTHRASVFSSPPPL